MDSSEVVVAGSPESNPVGTAGPNGAGACFPGGAPPALDSALCCDELVECLTTSGDPYCDVYFECLQLPESGPVLVGDWWFQQSVFNGEIFFVEDAVCGRINSDELNSRTRAELWDETFLDMDLSLFKKFSAGYDFRSTGGSSGGYLNMYLRVDGSSTAYYDCRLDFEIPNEMGTGTLVVTPETIGTSNQYRSGNTNGCPDNGQTSIQDYLGDNPDAVMGVGNGELYTFTLNGGSTGQNNNGQLICWSDVSIQYSDDSGATFVESFEFTTL